MVSDFLPFECFFLFFFQKTPAASTPRAEQIPKLDAAGVTLTYLSIGDAEKLNKFLSLNPSVPRDRSFVDESRTFDAYHAAGFGKIADTVPEKIDLKPPGFNMSQWFAYLTNVAALVGGRGGACVM